MPLSDLRNARKINPGRSIGAQKGFADAFNLMLDILNGLAPDPAMPGVRLTRGPGGAWRIGLEKTPNRGYTGTVTEVTGVSLVSDGIRFERVQKAYRDGLLVSVEALLPATLGTEVYNNV